MEGDPIFETTGETFSPDYAIIKTSVDQAGSERTEAGESALPAEESLYLP